MGFCFVWSGLVWCFCLGWKDGLCLCLCGFEVKKCLRICFPEGQWDFGDLSRPIRTLCKLQQSTPHYVVFFLLSFLL